MKAPWSRGVDRLGGIEGSSGTESGYCQAASTLMLDCGVVAIDRVLFLKVKKDQREDPRAGCMVHKKSSTGSLHTYDRRFE